MLLRQPTAVLEFSSFQTPETHPRSREASARLRTLRRGNGGPRPRCAGNVRAVVAVLRDERARKAANGAVADQGRMVAVLKVAVGVALRGEMPLFSGAQEPQKQ